MPPVGELTVKVEVPEPFDVSVTLAGFVEAVRPEGDTAVVRAILPVKPPRLWSVIVEVPDWAANIVKFVELEEMEKSTTLTVTCTERVREPLVPVTVRV